MASYLFFLASILDVWNHYFTIFFLGGYVRDRKKFVGGCTITLKKMCVLGRPGKVLTKKGEGDININRLYGGFDKFLMFRKDM